MEDNIRTSCVIDILGVWYVTRGSPGHVDSAVLRLALVAGRISCTVDALPGHYRGEFLLCEKSDIAQVTKIICFKNSSKVYSSLHFVYMFSISSQWWMRHVNSIALIFTGN